MSVVDPVLLPSEIQFGTEGGPDYDVSISQTFRGQEQRISRHAEAWHSYSLSINNWSRSNIAKLLGFYAARQGVVRGFLYKDWMDYSTHADGRSTPTFDDAGLEPFLTDGTKFQLRKKYADAANTVYRTITRPKTGTVKISAGGVHKTEGVDYTVNYSTGVVTFGVAPSGLITGGCEFYVPVHFGQDVMDGLEGTLTEFDINDAQKIPINEIKGFRPAPVDEDEQFGPPTISPTRPIIPTGGPILPGTGGKKEIDNTVNSNYTCEKCLYPYMQDGTQTELCMSTNAYIQVKAIETYMAYEIAGDQRASFVDEDEDGYCETYPDYTTMSPAVVEPVGGWRTKSGNAINLYWNGGSFTPRAAGPYYPGLVESLTWSPNGDGTYDTGWTNALPSGVSVNCEYRMKVCMSIYGDCSPLNLGPSGMSPIRKYPDPEVGNQFWNTFQSLIPQEPPNTGLVGKGTRRRVSVPTYDGTRDTTKFYVLEGIYDLRIFNNGCVSGPGDTCVKG